MSYYAAALRASNLVTHGSRKSLHADTVAMSLQNVLYSSSPACALCNHLHTYALMISTCGRTVQKAAGYGKSIGFKTPFNML